MTLLITVFAAIISTIAWYINTSKNSVRLNLGSLVLMYFGASIMWTVDAIFEYLQNSEAFFVPSTSDMINDAFLGFSVVALGLIIWIVKLLFKDPSGIIKR